MPEKPLVYVHRRQSETTTACARNTFGLFVVRTVADLSTFKLARPCPLCWPGVG